MKCSVTRGESIFAFFLDIDGVLYNYSNREEVCKQADVECPGAEGEEREEARTIVSIRFFNQEALTNLNKMISEAEKTSKIWIVISSNWRKKYSVDELKTLFGIHRFSKYIVDKTPEKVPEEEMVSYCYSERKHRASCRARQIKDWLDRNPQVMNYVVLDDTDDHLTETFGDKFLQTDYQRLLTSEIAQRFIEKVKDSARNSMLVESHTRNSIPVESPVLKTMARL